MSLTQTYYIASSARTKLGREASRSDHNLRLLVGHANLLDTLMVELQEAEREQEAWFNDSIRTANKPGAARHIQFIDAIAEELEEDSEDSEEDSDDDVYDEEVEDSFTPTLPAPELYTVSTLEVSEDDDEYDSEFRDFEYDDEHALTRVDSHPPELVHSDSDSDDESLPPSPLQSALEYSQHQTRNTKTAQYQQDGFFSAQIILPQQSGPMISAH
ncbi:hypothetical protein MBLNU459_g2100t1 [Dothideomycetes sp. NU459]